MTKIEIKTKITDYISNFYQSNCVKLEERKAIVFKDSEKKIWYLYEYQMVFPCSPGMKNLNSLNKNELMEIMWGLGIYD